MKSKFLSINSLDILKGFIMAVLGALVSGIYFAIENGGIELTWVFFKPIVFSSVGAGFLYLIKNVFTNSEDKFLKKEA